MNALKGEFLKLIEDQKKMMDPNRAEDTESSEDSDGQIHKAN